MDGREGEQSTSEKKKKKKTNRCAPHVCEREKGAAGTREKWGTTPPRVYQREGGPMYLLREEECQWEREKKRREKKESYYCKKEEVAHT